MNGRKGRVLRWGFDVGGFYLHVRVYASSSEVLELVYTVQIDTEGGRARGYECF